MPEQKCDGMFFQVKLAGGCVYFYSCPQERESQPAGDLMEGDECPQCGRKIELYEEDKR